MPCKRRVSCGRRLFDASAKASVGRGRNRSDVRGIADEPGPQDAAVLSPSMMEQPSFGFTEHEGAEEVPTYTVVELNSLVRDTLRRAHAAEVWVRGEVQNLIRSNAGHTYFTLVEKAGAGDRVQGRLEVALFRDDARDVRRALKDVPGAELGNDVEVRIRGRVTVYPPTGRFQLVMSGIDPVFTVGGIAASRERILRALAADGLLEANRARPLAPVPLRIGLITSSGSAAYHDFVDELRRAPYAWQVVVVDVRVQGAAASRRIKWALGELAQLDLDAVVLARGGGSRADLAAFDSDLVARAIAAMEVPVFTGVGHEIDRSVADEVAHTSCKTPTACAQVLVRQVDEFVAGLDHASHRVAARARHRTAIAARELDDAARRARRSATAVVGREHARLDRAHDRVDELARRRTADLESRLDACARRVGELGRRATRDARLGIVGRERELVTHSSYRLERAALRLDSSEAVVRALDPRRVLERGYSITRDADGRVVRGSDAVRAGELLETELATGRVTSRVETVEDATEEPGD
jgi:exodeoxyribonuclease VII large subunit